jgi:hypothetical protein
MVCRSGKTRCPSRIDLTAHYQPYLIATYMFSDYMILTYIICICASSLSEKLVTSIGDATTGPKLTWHRL